MSLNVETASEFLRVAAAAADRGDVREALYHMDRASELLQREPPQAETPGTLIGETIRYRHLGQVIAEKRRLANAG